jgi:hypothetical protein
MHLVLAAALILLLAAAFFSYYRTVPPLSRRLRYSLVSVRAAAFMLLAILFLDPRCVRRSTATDDALVVSLIDKSASMSLKADGRQPDSPTRFDRAVTLAARMDSSVSARGARTAAYYFAGSVLPERGDSIRPDGQGTDIAGSLDALSEKLEGENCTAIILFSDGMETGSHIVTGSLPSVPVFTVGLGDTSRPEDVRLKDVDYNPIVPAPSRNTIRATLSNTGGAAKRVHMRLTEGGSVLFEKDLRVEGGGADHTEEIPLEITAAGRRVCELQIDVDGYDAEPANNRREIAVDAEKADIKILIVDMLPTWEHYFFTGLLGREETVSFDVVGSPSGPGGRGKTIDPRDFASVLPRYDVLVLGTMTENLIGPAEAAAIERFIVSDGKGMLVLPGPASLFECPASWRLLEPVLPAACNPPCAFTFEYTAVVPGEQAALHPATMDLMPILTQTEWQERNPLLGYHARVSSKAGTQVLLKTRKHDSPALVYARSGSGRVAVLVSGPLWRWEFLPEQGTVYDQLVSKLVDVLARGEEAELFSLTTRKSVFESGEPVVLSAELFDRRMQPITGVPVHAELSKLDEQGQALPLARIAMNREGAQSSRFKASLPSLSPGTYRIRGRADLADRTTVSPEIEITVSSVSVEFQNVVQDAGKLEAIARRTGGVYVDASTVERIVKDVPVDSRVRRTTAEVPLRTSALLFALVLTLVCVEWIIRKRAGMI